MTLKSCPTFQVMGTTCDECLFSPERIVSGERMKEIVDGCLKKDKYFICHKASLAGREVCCRGFYDHFKWEVFPTRVAVILRLVEFIDSLV